MAKLPLLPTLIFRIYLQSSTPSFWQLLFILSLNLKVNTGTATLSRILSHECREEILRGDQVCTEVNPGLLRGVY